VQKHVRVRAEFASDKVTKLDHMVPCPGTPSLPSLMPRERGANPRKSDTDLHHQASPAAAYDDQVEPEKTAGNHELVFEGVVGDDPSLIHLNVRNQGPISGKRSAFHSSKDDIPFFTG